MPNQEKTSSEELESEFLSLQAIFPDAIEQQSSYKIRVISPHESNIYVDIFIPMDYPSASPTVEVCAPSLPLCLKRQLATDLKTICDDEKGSLILYELCDASLKFFESHQKPKRENKKMDGKNTAAISSMSGSRSSINVFSGPILEDRKSVFQAHVAKIDNKTDIASILDQLNSNNKIARATHNPYAWRLSTANENEDEYDSDGEDGAGSKLSHLLEMMKAKNVVVVVSRWYGGRKLGPDRFRHICNVAKNALIDGKFISTG